MSLDFLAAITKQYHIGLIVSRRTKILREFILGPLHFLPLLPAWTPRHDPFDDFKSTPAYESPEPNGLRDSATGIHRPDVPRRAADQMSQIDIPQEQAIRISRQPGVALGFGWISCLRNTAHHWGDLLNVILTLPSACPSWAAFAACLTLSRRVALWR